MSDFRNEVILAVSEKAAAAKIKAECVDKEKLRENTGLREIGPVSVTGSTVAAAAESVLAIYGAMCPGQPLKYAIVAASVQKTGAGAMLSMLVGVEDTRPTAERDKAFKAAKAEEAALKAPPPFPPAVAARPMVNDDDGA